MRKELTGIDLREKQIRCCFIIGFVQITIDNNASPIQWSIDCLGNRSLSWLLLAWDASLSQSMSDSHTKIKMSSDKMWPAIFFFRPVVSLQTRFDLKCVGDYAPVRCIRVRLGSDQTIKVHIANEVAVSYRSWTWEFCSSTGDFTESGTFQTQLIDCRQSEFRVLNVEIEEILPNTRSSIQTNEESFPTIRRLVLQRFLGEDAEERVTLLAPTVGGMETVAWSIHRLLSEDHLQHSCSSSALTRREEILLRKFSSASKLMRLRTVDRTTIDSLWLSWNNICSTLLIGL